MSETNQLPSDEIRAQLDDVSLAFLMGMIQSSTRSLEEATGGGMTLVPQYFSCVDVTDHMEAPPRTRQKVTAHTLGGFLSYVERFKNEETTLFVDPTTGAMNAIFDYHTPESAAHTDHRISFSPSLSPEWKRWDRRSGELYGQVEFSEFIEEHVEDITDPTGSKMLSVARNLEANKKVEFKSTHRPDTGDVQLKYQEETKGELGDSGSMPIPEYVKLGIPIFEGGSPYEVECRLRWRINGGTLKMGVKILRSDDLKRDAIESMVDELEETAGETPIHEVSL